MFYFVTYKTHNLDFIHLSSSLVLFHYLDSPHIVFSTCIFWFCFIDQSFHAVDYICHSFKKHCSLNFPIEKSLPKFSLLPIISFTICAGYFALRFILWPSLLIILLPLVAHRVGEMILTQSGKWFSLLLVPGPFLICCHLSPEESWFNSNVTFLLYLFIPFYNSHFLFPSLFMYFCNN